MKGWRLSVLGAVSAGALALVAAGCGGISRALPEPAPTPAVDERQAAAGGSVRVLFAGDVMLGRGVAALAARDPTGLLAGIRLQVGSADLAVANLESPLTERAHDPAAGPNALEADPASATLLAAAGFDAMSIANNHAGDAGPETVSDTTLALAAAGLDTVGAGRSAGRAFEPIVLDVGGVRVALLAFDAT